MHKRRLIPVLFLKDSWMVRSESFSFHQTIGDPVAHVRRLAEWDVDELIVIDIGTGEMTFEHHRMDYRTKPVKSLVEFIQLIAVECHIPLTLGGRIRSLEDIHVRIRNGADKVSLNTMLFDHPDDVSRAASVFGSQAIVASIDYKIVDGRPHVFRNHGTMDTQIDPAVFAKQAVDMGTGEILLNSIDRDGMACGYDLETIELVSSSVSVPVIAVGGGGSNGQMLKCFQNTSASAIAAGNIYHFKELAYPLAKKYLRMALEDIR